MRGGSQGWEQKSNLLGVKGAVKPKINQDRIFVTPKFCGKKEQWLFACYDGNGPKGEDIADATGKTLVRAYPDATPPRRAHASQHASALATPPPTGAAFFSHARPGARSARLD